MDRNTKKKLANIILGGDDGVHDPTYPKYRSGYDLTGFFEDAGLPQYKHNGSAWRRGFVQETLLMLTDKEITKIIERLCIRVEYATTERWSKAVALVNEALEPEGLNVVTNSSGKQVAIENIDPIASVKLGPTPENMRVSTIPLTSKDVMVVHGRNTAVRDAMFALLYAVGLQPIEWNNAVARAGGGSPYTGHVVKTAIEQAGAVVVLLTADDLAKLDDPFLQSGDASDERNMTGQPRPNVILELGMALMADENKTIIVEFGKMRIITDILGRNSIRFADNPQSRQAILQRLESASCPVKRHGDYWMSAGNFFAASQKSAVPADKRMSPQDAQHQTGGAGSINVQGGRDVNARWNNDK